MAKRFVWVLLILFAIILFYNLNYKNEKNKKIKVGAELIDNYIYFIKDKRIAVVANHSSLIQKNHLVDSLIALNINIVKIFSPEHGFRGDVDAGEYFSDYIDTLTGLQVISLYGKKFKPSEKQLKDIDLVLFDIQDVGVRFYTYISTLHYMIEACAENNVEFIILDRPNPNGFYIDGPMLQMKHSSFVGLHPIPLVYGMTIGELALMINGEGWLKNGIQCELKVIPCEGYDHNSRYELPINPSPNLQTMEAVYLYPSLGLFEGTVMSVGRGTDFPFRILGHPKYSDTAFLFIPVSIPRICIDPLYKNEKCYGIDLRKYPKEELSEIGEINISLLVDSYNLLKNDVKFFNSYFNMLAGSPDLRKYIENGATPPEIKAIWSEEMKDFKLIRKKYLLYEDFKEQKNQ
ncbi:MAG: DUF1343 domain-containing protein [Bacteroidales bacterium]|nr:DUF1343 domain-containing protein [Bacteroidales bacterium]